MIKLIQTHHRISGVRPPSRVSDLFTSVILDPDVIVLRPRETLTECRHLNEHIALLLNLTLKVARRS